QHRDLLNCQKAAIHEYGRQKCEWPRAQYGGRTHQKSRRAGRGWSNRVQTCPKINTSSYSSEILSSRTFLTTFLCLLSLFAAMLSENGFYGFNRSGGRTLGWRGARRQ